MMDQAVALLLSLCRNLLVASGTLLATIVIALSQGWKESAFRRPLLIGGPFIVVALFLPIVGMVSYSICLSQLGYLRLRFKRDGYATKIRSERSSG